MTDRLDGTHVLVTGAGGGMGAASARHGLPAWDQAVIVDGGLVMGN